MTDPQPLSSWGLIVYAWNHWSEIQGQWALVLAAFWAFIGAIVNMASLITPFTKTPEDDRIVSKLKAAMHQFSITNPK